MPTFEKIFGELIVEWDTDKARKNLMAHSVDFDEAVSVLNDDFAKMYQDNRDYDGERRYIQLGVSNQGRLLYVVWTLRDNRYRIISARKANKHEQREYQR